MESPNVPANMESLQTPCLLVNMEVVKANIARMKQRSVKLGLKLRPHMKTNKTVELGELMTGPGKRGVTVSTLAEAEFYAEAGFDDILYAYIFTADKIPRLKRLANRLEEFHIMVDNTHHLNALRETPLEGGKSWSLFLKIDIGYHRAGVQWEFGDDVVRIARAIVETSHVELAGIYAHEGHSYNLQGETALHQHMDQVAQNMHDTKQMLVAAGVQCPVVAVGSTPSCSQPGDLLKLVTEIHPGNFVFYDVQQMLIGSCSQQDIAVKVATRVLAHYPARAQLLVDAGWLALSHDGGKHPHDSVPNDSVCLIDGHPHLRLFRMSQEVSLVESVSGPLDFSVHPIGSFLFLLPYHACATAALHPVYHTYSSNKLTKQIKPCRGW